jgi:hypothetical protein
MPAVISCRNMRRLAMTLATVRNTSTPTNDSAVRTTVVLKPMTGYWKMISLAIFFGLLHRNRSFSL